MAPLFSRLSWKSLPLWSSWLVYSVLVIPTLATYSQRIDPDCVSYVRNAEHLAHGRFAASVSGYWSPLLSWSIAPAIYIGLDPLPAAHWVQCAWGLFLLAGVWRLVSATGVIGRPWDFIGMLCVAVATAKATTVLLTPDPMLAGVLFWYFAWCIQPNFLRSRHVPLVAGLIGGVAFLAKSYAFPFFLCHHLLNSIWHAWCAPVRPKLRDVVVPWCIGMLGFLLIAGPWVAVLSSKYDRFTFSTVMSFAHYQSGPPETIDMPQVLYSVHEPLPQRKSIWETPDSLSFSDWSPLSSRANAVHQIRHIIKILGYEIGVIATFDFFACSPGCLLLIPFIAIAFGSREQARLAVWTLLTIGLFLGGLLPVCFEDRYITPLLWPLICFLPFGLVTSIAKGPVSSEPNLFSSRALAWVLCGCWSFSLIFPQAEHFRDAWGDGRLQWQGYHRCGEKLKAEGLTDRFACSKKTWAYGLYIAYHADAHFLGEIAEGSAPEIENELRRLDATVFITSSEWPPCDPFRSTTTWKLIDEFSFSTVTVYVYVSPSAAAQRVEASGFVGIAQD